MKTNLTPTQQRTYEALRRDLKIGHILILSGDAGMGKTTLLRELYRRSPNAAWVHVGDFLAALRAHHPLALEEAFEQVVSEALAAHDLVFVDDLQLVADVVSHCRSYPRAGLLDAPLTALAATAISAGKRLVFSTDGYPPAPLAHRAYTWAIGEFDVEDYQALCRTFLGRETARALDYVKIHRFAPHLDGHQIRGACEWLAANPARAGEPLDTEQFIEYLRSRQLTSNVDLAEVQAVDLADLKGVDDVIRSLEANIVLPLENDELAAEFDLKPKRGVLLLGPPGTGKTTIGRALAHRLKSKFFLVDGTFISGTGGFYGGIQEVFEGAKRNAPSIIFIDDSDAIFETGEELGLYRYLLTMLDGLESESAGRVCVMMTAMEVGHLPPALLRSGRIELWLEMTLPDASARAEILSRHTSALPRAIGTLDLPRLVSATEGFTGADLKRLVEDGKALFAFDKAREAPLRPATEYFLAAVETVRANKERYAQAEAEARRQRPSRPPWYDVMEGMMAAAGAEDASFTWRSEA